MKIKQKLIYLALINLAGNAQVASGELDPEAKYRIAENIANAKDYPSAINFYRQYIKAGGDTLKGYLGLGIVQLKAGSAPKSITSFDKVLEIEENNVEALCGKAQGQMSLGMHVAAVDTYERAIGADGKAFCALNGRAVTQNMIGNHKKAIRYFDEALKVYPHDKVLQTNRGLALAFNGEYEEAIRVLKPYAHDGEATARDRQNLALAYGLADQLDKASKYFSMDLSHSDVQRNLGFLTIVKQSKVSANSIQEIVKMGGVKNPPQDQDKKPLPDSKITVQDITLEGSKDA